MKRITLLTAIAMIGFTVNTFGQEASAEGEASATIIKPLTLEAGDDLAFGDIVVYNSTAGTIVLPADGGDVNATGGVQSLGGTITAGSFTVSGASGRAFVVNLPETATLSISDSEDNMEVKGFNSSYDEEGAVNEGTLEGETATFKVGATLSVDANQAEGDYTGKYTVTVQYL